MQDFHSYSILALQIFEQEYLMTRMSKQQTRRNQCPKKRKLPLSVKTGSKKDALDLGYKEHYNAVTDEANASVFIARIK